VGFAKEQCIDCDLGWRSDPPLIGAHPVIMSDISDGLRSYLLFMYSQVWNLGQPYFLVPPIARASTYAVGSRGLRMKKQQKLCTRSRSCFQHDAILSVPLFWPTCSCIAFFYFNRTQRTLA